MVLPLPSQLGFIICRKFALREIKHAVVEFVLNGDVAYPYLCAVFGQVAQDAELAPLV
jgi:hypothetical protein